MAINVPARVDPDRFNEEGYLVVEDFFDVERELEPVVAEYMDLLEGLVGRWRAEGTLSSDYADLPFAQRLARVLNETGAPGFQPFDISLPFAGVTEETPFRVHLLEDPARVVLEVADLG